MTRISGVFLLLAVMLAPALGSASQQGTQAIRNWVAADRCAREAQEAFPDYSAEAYAKRDAKLKDCLAGKALPPRAPVAPGQ